MHVKRVCVTLKKVMVSYEKYKIFTMAGLLPGCKLHLAVSYDLLEGALGLTCVPSLQSWTCHHTVTRYPDITRLLKEPTVKRLLKEPTVKRLLTDPAIKWLLDTPPLHGY